MLYDLKRVIQDTDRVPQYVERERHESEILHVPSFGRASIGTPNGMKKPPAGGSDGSGVEHLHRVWAHYPGATLPKPLGEAKASVPLFNTHYSSYIGVRSKVARPRTRSTGHFLSPLAEMAGLAAPCPRTSHRDCARRACDVNPPLRSGSAPPGP
jgi:hypothetical protein